MKLSFCVRALALAISFSACDSVSPPSTGCTSSFIVGGLPATTHPEAVVLQLSQHGFVTGLCSGSLIAPKVVLTAGHCVASFTGWDVQAPFANQSTKASAGETFDWTYNGNDHVTQNQHDVGLVYLDTPIDLPAYPAIAEAPVPEGTNIVNLGIIDDGRVSGSLFVSKPLAASGAARAGFPFDYVTSKVIELGDSGGPVEVADTTLHTIVAVNSGVTGNLELLARVDLLQGWIKDRIATHGGGGATEPPALVPAAATSACAP